MLCSRQSAVSQPSKVFPFSECRKLFTPMLDNQKIGFNVIFPSKSTGKSKIKTNLKNILIRAEFGGGAGYRPQVHNVYFRKHLLP